MLPVTLTLALAVSQGPGASWRCCRVVGAHGASQAAGAGTSPRKPSQAPALNILSLSSLLVDPMQRAGFMASTVVGFMASNVVLNCNVQAFAQALWLPGG